MEQQITNTVDVIFSMEGGFPIILEVIGTENINDSKERQKYYSKFYKDVHVVFGIDFIQKNKYFKTT